MLLQVGLIVDCALGLRSLDYGLGVHQWNVPLLHITDFLKVRNTSFIIMLNFKPNTDSSRSAFIRHGDHIRPDHIFHGIIDPSVVLENLRS